MSFSPSRLRNIDKAFAGFDRPTLLRTLGLDMNSVFVGDITDLRPAVISGARGLTVNQIHASCVDGGARYECCTGAKLRKHGQTTVTIPCFEVDILEKSSVCQHCYELWGHVNADGWFVYDDSMSAVAHEYENGQSGMLKNWRCMKAVEDKYHDEITAVKDVLQHSPFALATNWPEADFQYLVKEFLLDSAVLFQGSGRSKNPFKRSKREQEAIATFMEQMVPLWLRIRAFVSLKDLHFCVQELQESAQVIAAAATARMQQEFEKSPMYCGALLEADIMLAGFTYAASLVKSCFEAEPKEKPSSRPEWGPVVAQLKIWAEGVPEVERPKKLELKTGGMSTAKKKTPAAFYAVAVGRMPGIYVSVDMARAQTDRFTKPVWKRCRSRQEAEDFINANTAVPSAKTKAPAKSSKKYKRVKGKQSDSPTRKSARKELFAEAAQPDSDVPSQVFAVYSGTSRGVYATFADMSLAVSSGGGKYVVCESEDEAWAKIEAAAADEYADAMEEPEPSVESYVVWAGRRVGVMSLQACIQATKDLVGVKMAGPLSEAEANESWQQHRDEAKVLVSGEANEDGSDKALGPVTPAQSAAPATPKAATALPVGAIDTPSDAALALALQNGTSKVWAAVRRPMKGVISLSKHAIEGFATPKVFDVSSSVIDNVVYAERWLTEQLVATNAVSIADKLAAARARIAGESGKKAETQPSSTPKKERSTGKQSGKLKGRMGLQRSREAAQIARIFIDDPEPIRILEAPESLHAYELIPLALPSTPLFGKASKGFGMKEYFKAVSAKSGDFAWPLMDLSPFLSFCRRAIDTCRSSESASAAASIVALDKLSEMAIRIHDMMSRAKSMGDDNMRFKVRMYMHLEYMSETGKLHVGPQAMATFRDAIDIFGQKVPGFVVDLTGMACTPVAASPSKGTPKLSKSSVTKVHNRGRSLLSKPKFGCWLCPSMDHYVNKTSHPTREKLSDVMKSSILTRIDFCKEYPEAEREAEKKRVRAYWLKHKL